MLKNMFIETPTCVTLTKNIIIIIIIFILLIYLKAKFKKILLLIFSKVYFLGI